MFSLPKLLVLLLIIAVVMVGFRLVGSYNRVREENARRAGAEEERRRLANEDLVQCRVCGVFVQADTTACNRSDCPYPRRRA